MATKLKYCDLVEIIEKETGLKKNQTDDFIKKWVAIINEGLKRDGKVRISQFGTFKLRHVDERAGINPRTMESIVIPEHTKVVFSGAKHLKEKVNHRYNLLKAIPIEDEKAQKTEKKEEIKTEQLIKDKENIVRKDYTPTGVQPAPVKKKETAEKKSELVMEKSPEPKKEDFEKGAPFEPENVEVVIQKNPQPKEEIIESTTTVGKTEDEKKSKLWYLIAAALLLVLVLIFVFLPTQDEPIEQVDQIAEKPVIQEEVKTVKKEKKFSTPGGEHAVVKGDKLWDLSESFYKDSYLWPNIFRANDKVISNPDVLKLGYTLTVPPLEGTIKKLSANDSVNIALGFYKAYEAYKKNGNKWAKYYLWVCKKYDAETFMGIQDQVEQDDAQFALSMN